MIRMTTFNLKYQTNIDVWNQRKVIKAHMFNSNLSYQIDRESYWRINNIKNHKLITINSHKKIILITSIIYKMPDQNNLKTPLKSLISLLKYLPLNNPKKNHKDLHKEITKTLKRMLVSKIKSLIKKPNLLIFNQVGAPLNFRLIIKNKIINNHKITINTILLIKKA